MTNGAIFKEISARRPQVACRRAVSGSVWATSAYRNEQTVVALHFGWVFDCVTGDEISQQEAIVWHRHKQSGKRKAVVEEHKG